ncbi:MAG: hypothetical protein M1818_003367 [Claussenomyces sp. TS43310]|nr:MAG: hypothetical protein M1818_003367 [Claussenomyces sp. TS43310]
MVYICPRIHFYEINDQVWFPQYLREKVQSCLAIAWTFRAPVIQKTSPAKLVATTIYDVLSRKTTDYTYVDFCAGAGGPTPFIEQHLNAQLQNRLSETRGAGVKEQVGRSRATRSRQETTGVVKFVLTDLHPHLPDWTEASKKSENLTFVSKPVDAANAPVDLIDNDGKKVFRLFNLAFHHFDDDLGRAILRNTLETADGFGIFELQERTISSLVTIFFMGLLFALITPFYFWRSPGHLFFTYVIPIIPFVLVVDGYISCLRSRSPDEVHALMKQCGTPSDGWAIKSGSAQHTWPSGYMIYIMGIKG